MSRLRNLFTNSIIFAIGNLGSKLISFLMTPFYTSQLVPNQFGTADYLLTLSNLLLPLVALSIVDAVFRFLMEDRYEKKGVVTNALILSLCTLFFSSLMIFIFFRSHNAFFIIQMVFVGTLLNLFQQLARGIGLTKQFAVTGIVVAIVTVIMNFLLLGKFHLGILGYMESSIIAQGFGAIYIFVASKSWNYIHYKYLNFALLKSMLIFSIPLIPNALTWWASSTVSRLFIVSYIGAAANGIYAIANKIPSLVSMVYSIFTQAWEITAVSEYDSDDRSDFYSNIFNMTMKVLLYFSFILTVFSKVVVSFLANYKYEDAWQYVAIISVSVVYSSLSAFIGTTYIASMRTRGLMLTTWIGAIINIILNWLLVPNIGVWGAAIGGFCAFFCVLYLRLIDSKKFIKIKLNRINFIFGHIFILISFIVLYVNISFISTVLIEIVLVLIYTIHNLLELKGYFKPFLKVLTNRIKKL